jgi:hypothetical protein
MLQFSELSQEAKSIAVEGFINDFDAYFKLGDSIFKESFVQEFLSKSRVHRYDENGVLLGKIVRIQGVETFERAEKIGGQD